MKAQSFVLENEVLYSQGDVHTFWKRVPLLATKDERSLMKTLPIRMTKFNVFTEKFQCSSRARLQSLEIVHGRFRKFNSKYI